MRRLVLVVILVWYAMPLAFLAAQGPIEQAIPGAAVSVGQQYFVQYCSACHGVDGRGDGPVAPVLRIPPPDLTRLTQRYSGHFPDAEVAAKIDGRAMVRTHGSREMPVWGLRFSDKFGGADIGEEAVRGHLLVLIEYLKALQQ